MQTLNHDIYEQLDSVVAQILSSQNCKIVLSGCGNASKAQKQLSWDRVNAIIEYMTRAKGVERSRFIFQYGQAGDINSVMIRVAANGEDGPSTLPPPYPNLR